MRGTLKDLQENLIKYTDTISLEAQVVSIRTFSSVIHQT